MTELSPIRVAFMLFPNVTQLDLTGPAQVLSRLGNVTVDLVAKTAAPCMTDAQFALTPTATFANYAGCDILCVPGGFGDQAVMEDDESMAWVRRMADGALWVTSVCTGALILGAAGLLKGYRATTHWGSHHHLASFGAIPVQGRVVFDRNRVTGGGVTAGIDFGLALIAAIRGEMHARFVQLSVEYDPHPPFDSGSPERALPETVAAYRAMTSKHAPDRDARRQAVAAKLGLEVESPSPSRRPLVGSSLSHWEREGGAQRRKGEGD